MKRYGNPLENTESKEEKAMFCKSRPCSPNDAGALFLQSKEYGDQRLASGKNKRDKSPLKEAQRLYPLVNEYIGNYR